MVDSGVPDEIPTNLTARYAIRKGMKSTMDFARRLEQRVGIQDLNRTESSPVIDFTKKNLARGFNKNERI